MKVLVVSYDKTLTNKLSEIFKGYEFFHARSGDEVTRASGEGEVFQDFPEEVDLIIYDAVSGAFSEEDINNLYSNRFQSAKYIVLIDELFPVDMNNIIPKNKIGIPRDKAIPEIQNLMSTGTLVSAFQKTTEQAPTRPVSEPPIPTPPPPAPAQPIFEPSMELESAIPGFDLSSFELEQPTSPAIEEPIPGFGMPAAVPSFSQEAPTIKESPPLEVPSIASSKAKLLIAAFEKQLIDKVKSALANYYDITVVSNMKEAPAAAKRVDVVLFDTISGNLAERILTEMSGDMVLSDKHYVLLLDELFAIDADRIPLPKKQSYSREKDIDMAISYLKDLANKLTPSFAEPAPAKEPIPPAFAMPQAPQEEKAFSLLEELVKEEAKPEMPIEEFSLEEVMPSSLVEEDLIQSAPSAQPPPIFAPTPTYEKQEPPPRPAYIPQEMPPAPAYTPPAYAPQPAVANLEAALANLIAQELSEIKLARILTSNFKAENVSRQIAENLRGIIREELQALLEQEISRALSKLDISSIIKEQAYKVLKESIKELLI